MISFCLLFATTMGYAQENNKQLNDYFEQIRKNEAELTAFISQMPKGGDLHNHYSGAIYGETYLKRVIDADYCINPKTLEIVLPIASGACPTASFVKFSSLQSGMKPDAFNSLKGNLLRLWSTKDHAQLHNDSREDHFFATFGNFSIASGMDYGKGLLELKERAKAENLSYIETMFNSIKLQNTGNKLSLTDNPDTVKYYNDKLIALGQQQDSLKVKQLLQYLYYRISTSLPVTKTAAAYNHFLDSVHNNFRIDDELFTMRYQTFITRINDPLPTFMNLLTAFEAVKTSSSHLLVGVNIVAPEDNPVSMRDYWLHMQMFACCDAIYHHSVKYSMHAGELAEGYVEPENLTWHINAAVRIAGAHRIGHGVDIPYEKDNYALLNEMSKREKNIPVEINLSSNEFILGIKNDQHPILLYKHFGVPIVISTDDPGVSRSSLTEQYVLLAKRYKEIRYPEIKEYVYNSIRYSFMEEAKKIKLIADLDKRFQEFELYIINKRPG